MKKLTNIIIAITLFLIPTVMVAQTPPPLGIATDFVLFTSVGALTNSGFTQITGNIGTNTGAFSGFGSINGEIHIEDEVSAQCAIDVGIAYTNLSNQIPGVTLAPVLGAGQVLLPNVYLIPSAGSLIGTLTLDGGGDPNACFVFQFGGAGTTSDGTIIVLTNGAKACNVFWRIDGAMTLATNNCFKGTIIASGAIVINPGGSLEGRAFTIVGANTVGALYANTPCTSTIYPGPIAPNMNAVECFAILTSIGKVSNTGTTNVVGHIGTNSGIVTGFNPLGVVGLIHPIPDVSTAQGSADLKNLYSYLYGLTTDIEMLCPVLMGNSQVLTPHVYNMNAAALLTDTLYLDGLGAVGSVFVIRIIGSLTTRSSQQVILVGEAQAKNVFWLVDGAVNIGSGSNFSGTIVANGAITLNEGVILNGRALSTAGSITTQDVNITSSICAFPLPIELLSFTANAKDEHIQLNWVTASEANNEYFTVEKSLDGINFETLAIIDGAGNSSQILNYSVVDNAPLNGISYYRLKQTDYNGQTDYSNMVAVEFKNMNDFIFNIYPNPNDGEVFNLQISNNNNAEVLLVVYDILNKEVYSKVILTNNNKKKVYAIYPSQKLNPGVYLIKATSDNKIYKKRLIVINNK